MINRVILVGNLTRDTESGAGLTTQSARMRIATNSVWRDAEGNRQEHAEFHTVVAFGRLAEVCASYCVKGRRVYIEGRLRTREYQGADGMRRHATEIVAEAMKLLDRAPAGSGNAASADETDTPAPDESTEVAAEAGSEDQPAAPAARRRAVPAGA